MKKRIIISLQILFLIFSVVWIFSAYLIITENPILNEEAESHPIKINPDEWNPYGWYV